MMRALTVLAALVVLAGCGSVEQDSTGSSDPVESEPTSSAQVGECAVDSPEVTGARTLTSADLDGDGSREPVRLTGPGGECPDLLFAELGVGYVATDVKPGGPPVTTAFAVDVPGRDGELVVTSADHPRGGFQLRVYAAGDATLVELEHQGQALVPFVALDVQEHPLSVDCTDGGVVLTEAVPHEPVGVVFTWDVKRTTYAVDGTEVTAGPTEEIAGNVLPRQLEAKYPDLVKHTAFESCRAAG